MLLPQRRGDWIRGRKKYHHRREKCSLHLRTRKVLHLLLHREKRADVCFVATLIFVHVFNFCSVSQTLWDRLYEEKLTTEGGSPLIHGLDQQWIAEWDSDDRLQTEYHVATIYYEFAELYYDCVTNSMKAVLKLTEMGYRNRKVCLLLVVGHFQLCVCFRVDQVMLATKCYFNGRRDRKFLTWSILHRWAVEKSELFIGWIQRPRRPRWVQRFVMSSSKTKRMSLLVVCFLDGQDNFSCGEGKRQSKETGSCFPATKETTSTKKTSAIEESDCDKEEREKETGIDKEKTDIEST